MKATGPREYHKEEVITDDKSSISSVNSDKVVKTHSPGNARDMFNEPDVSQNQPAPFIKSAAEKKLLRKINLALLPFVGAITFVQFVDKVQLGITAIFGIIEDTRLTGSQFGWLSSIFYIGYICFQLPNNYLIQKIPVGKYLGSLTILWGIAMACTALCHTFAQLAVVRALLGVFEAGASPCLLIIINTMYRRSEQSAAYGFMYASLGVGSVMAALCTYGISFIDHAQGIHTWRWPYIIWGSLTVLFGILTLFFMPDSPYSFMFRLTEDEKQIVEERIRDNAVVRVHDIKRYQIWEALMEPRLWLLSLSTLLFNMAGGGIITFGTIIVNNLGFSMHQNILFGIATAGISAISCAIVVLIARKSGQLYLPIVIAASFGLVGYILLAVLPNTGVKVVGYLLSTSGSGIAIIFATIISTNVAGYTKKVFYNAMLMIFNTLGNIIGPLVMLEREAPLYKTGMILFCVSDGLIILMMFIVRQLMARENKIRLQNPVEKEVGLRGDLTDRENKTIIYKL